MVVAITDWKVLEATSAGPRYFFNVLLPVNKPPSPRKFVDILTGAYSA
jgi:hypothetical protein